MCIFNWRENKFVMWWRVFKSEWISVSCLHRTGLGPTAGPWNPRMTQSLGTKTTSLYPGIVQNNQPCSLAYPYSRTRRKTSSSSISIEQGRHWTDILNNLLRNKRGNISLDILRRPSWNRRVWPGPLRQRWNLLRLRNLGDLRQTPQPYPCRQRVQEKI